MEVESASMFDARMKSFDTVNVQIEQLSIKDNKDLSSSTTIPFSLAASVNVVKNLLPNLLKGAKVDGVDEENEVNGNAV